MSADELICCSTRTPQGYHDALVPIAAGQYTVRNLLKGWQFPDNGGTVIDGGPMYNHTRHISKTGLVLETIYHAYYNLPIASDPLTNWGHCFVGSPDVPGSPLLFGQVRHFGCPYVGKAAYSSFDRVLEFFRRHPKA